MPRLKPGQLLVRQVPYLLYSGPRFVQNHCSCKDIWGDGGIGYTLTLADGTGEIKYSGEDTCLVCGDQVQSPASHAVCQGSPGLISEHRTSWIFFLQCWVSKSVTSHIGGVSLSHTSYPVTLSYG